MSTSALSSNLTSPPSAAPTQNQDRLRLHFSSRPDSAHPEGWDALWKDGTFLPWDRGHCNPALIDTLQERTATIGTPLKSDGTRKRALVPGCGKGYDVAVLAARGYDAYGLEISEGAVGTAREWVEGETGQGGEGEYEVQDEKIGKGKMQVLLGDFFSDGWVRESGGLGEGFDLIYDITFLCALPPSLRPRWAARMAQLLAPDGALICLEFPTHKPPASGGPPFASPSLVYEELLKRPGDEISYDEAGKVVKTDREENDKALIRVEHWTPARTHAVGIIKGEVKDRVSIWKHK
ncbi:S-adenosyl-L-methionine-dependent methyltransferase [Polyplosphaeria fusca]|uniref:S-adenosyl-L-methionine-dependent methyltransferase n=1 Tax=Polyplosphaeria fusca TaxID=682080 RepID=A0A9P4V6K3_9PLEO|nr:S-adenosyl-L-methionine-dependent methyltransferase [Polyplosphaeria fusca]